MNETVGESASLFNMLTMVELRRINQFLRSPIVIYLSKGEEEWAIQDLYQIFAEGEAKAEGFTI